jgi:hypothetical protein
MASCPARQSGVRAYQESVSTICRDGSGEAGALPGAQAGREPVIEPAAAEPPRPAAACAHRGQNCMHAAFCGPFGSGSCAGRMPSSAVMVPVLVTAALLASCRAEPRHWREYLDVIERAIENAAPLQEDDFPAVLLLSRRDRALRARAEGA